MSKASKSSPQLHLPPGFRFHPTDEELVVHYLAKKAEGKPFPVPVISEVDLYKFNPWDLPDKAYFGEKEWYFFTPRDRKYPNGARPNRAAAGGYWKATGTDKPILTRGNKKVGVKKALVFYDGKAPKGVKTNWIMHEYRLVSPGTNKPTKERSSLRLDDWVLCRIYEKTSSAFKVMVSNIEAQPAEEPSEVEATEGDAEGEEEVSGLDEVLASLPDIEGSKVPFFSNFGAADDYMISSRAQQAAAYFPQPFDDSALETDSKLNYWALYSQGLAISPMLSLPHQWQQQQQQLTPCKKRQRAFEDDDVQSTCRSPLTRSKQKHHSLAIF